MSSALLPIIESNAAFELDNALRNLAKKNMDYKFMYVVWSAYRNRGVCALLLGCDAKSLYTDLCKSACSYLYFLKKMVPKAERITSNSSPFFDAIACGDLPIAKEIAVASRSSHNPGEEYIDDFLYVYFLMKMFFLKGKHGELVNLLDQFEAVAADDTASRYELCKSFLEKDQQAFDDAFDSIIELYIESLNTKMEKGLISDEDWAVSAPLFIEGLALLRLAEKLGLRTQKDYTSIPEIARLTELPDYQSVDWLTPYS